MKSVEITANGTYGSYKTSDVLEVMKLAHRSAWEKFDTARKNNDDEKMLKYISMINDIDDFIDWITPES